MPEQQIKEVNGWVFQVSECGNYIYLHKDGYPGSFHIKSDTEGFVVDIWNDNDDPEVEATTFCLYTELEPE